MPGVLQCFFSLMEIKRYTVLKSGHERSTSPWDTTCLTAETEPAELWRLSLADRVLPQDGSGWSFVDVQKPPHSPLSKPAQHQVSQAQCDHSRDLGTSFFSHGNDLPFYSCNKGFSSSCAGGFPLLRGCPGWKTERLVLGHSLSMTGIDLPVQYWDKTVICLYEICLVWCNTIWAVKKQSSFECICVPNLPRQSLPVRSPGPADSLAVGQC